MTLPPAARRRDRLASLVSLGFVACAAVAIGHGLWALYGSGARLASLDVPGAGPGTSAVIGPISLEPGMNPLRAVLRAGHAPLGSSRIRYAIEMVDPAGHRMWARDGAIGTRDDEASIVWTTTSLSTFDVAAPGAHVVRVRFEDGSMDDLRKATIELRRNVTRVEPRLTWGFGLAAVALLMVAIILGRGRPWPTRKAESVPRAAA